MFDQPILGGYEQALQLSGSPRAPTYTFNGTSAGAPAFPNAVTTGTLSQQSPWAIDPAFQVAHTWQTNAQLERALGPRSDGVDRVDVRERQSAAGRHRRQPDQPGRLARRRPPDLQHRGERDNAPGSAVQPHPRSAVDWRVDVQVDDGRRHEALRAGAVVQRAVLARQRARQHAAAHAAHRAVRGGPLGSEQSRSRPRAESARHAAQRQRQHRLHVDEQLVESGRPRPAERQRVRRAASAEQRSAAQHRRQPAT